MLPPHPAVRTAAAGSRAAGAQRTAAAREPAGRPEGRPRFAADAACLAEAQRSFTRAILASATPDREDRLFPGDIRQFEGEALGIAHGAAGVLYAQAGPALLLVRMYERTGDPGYLDLASVELGRGLDACVTDGKGALAVDEGWRTLPYLGDGSAGIGLVAEDYLCHRENDRFAGAVPLIRLAARSQYYAQSGLLAGRAGMILYLSRRHPSGRAADDPDVAAQIRRLEWHVISYADGLAFPGDQLLRLSMDLATGTAGVMLGFHAASSQDGANLPFLGPMTSLRLYRSDRRNS